ncbi:phosphotransferase [Actinoplanes sp. NBRC 103695]|uniref:phosphotransferase family protein n=1 Tax=Actinoplanes sp. NBRC 103695 TaxID=3032202 RepID=UPI0024A3CB2E|nr:phosphotransferase [Actinoplanes sp. NBRC 103695]GLZ01565.1 hypothetical protein Acsp02_88160 [Actinoplanes sp. NBRC 103695]
MPDFLRDALRILRVEPREDGRRLESRSGAGVHPVTTAEGDAAYLKIMPGTLGARELRFYREVAPGAPVRTPALLGHLETDAGVALLLAAAGQTLDVDRWTPGMWVALGRDLAALHEMPGNWAGPDELGGVDHAAAAAYWGPDFDGVLAGADRLWDAMAAPAPVFAHGDCHTENITHVDGSPVFCDWQNAGTGRASADLALLSVRATPAGVTVPPALLDAYLAGRSGPAAELRRAIVAEELAVLLFLWPRYAGYNTAEGNARIRARALRLAEV